ncbi:MAG: hypothetical protein ACYTEP_06205 [Planctomycetota bacterium]|jgi:hypothetical protein
MKGTFNLICLAGCVLSTPAFAQDQPLIAVMDDFEDGVIDPAWSIGLTLGAIVEVQETQGVLRASGSLLTQSEHGSFSLTRSFPSMGGPFQLDIPLAWSPDVNDPFGGTSSVTVDLIGANQLPVASWALDDSNPSGGGQMQIVGPTIAYLIPNLELQGRVYMRIRREANDHLDFTMLGSQGPRTGHLGFLPSEITGLRVTFRHDGVGSPPFTTLELDSVLLTDALTPLLDVSTLVAGSPGTLTLFDVTPLRSSRIALSLAGPGPTLTPFGLADLSAPITVLPGVFADASGQASVSFTLPASAAGHQVWFQGLDPADGTFTQAVTTVVQ